MTKLILAIAIILGSGRAWASDYWHLGECPQGCVSISTLIAVVKDYQEAVERQARSELYRNFNSTKEAELTEYWVKSSNDHWTIIRDSQVYTLDEFISSGRLCEFRGKHAWEQVEEYFVGGCNTWNWAYHSPAYRCAICHRCRRKIKVQKEESEWEK